MGLTGSEFLAKVPVFTGLDDGARVDLARFLNNFVAFSDFYTRRAKAMFQAGTLYLDGRACELCMRVDDPAKHAALAGLSMMYLAYCDLTRKGSAENPT